MGLRVILSQALKPALDLVYPPRCPVCGDATGEQGALCLDCWRGLSIPGDPQCASCSWPLGTGTIEVGAQCAQCLVKSPTHSGIFAATFYNDVSRKLILSFKHGGKIGLSPLLGRMMAARMPESEGDELPLVVPVPLHRWRLWSRGYNQAALLASELVREGKGRLCVDALERTIATPSLGGLGKKARAKVLKGAIRVRQNRVQAIRDRNVILADDVLTSGATTDACVHALLNAGARSVRIACFARVIDDAVEKSSARTLGLAVELDATK